MNNGSDTSKQIDMSGFSYSKYMGKINVNELIEKNQTFILEKSFNIPNEILCIYCSKQKPSNESLRLSSGKFLCAKCFQELKTIKYPEIYQSRYELYLKQKAAILLKYEDDLKTWNARKNIYERQVMDYEEKETGVNKSSLGFLYFICFLGGFIGLISLKKSETVAGWGFVTAIFSFFIAFVSSKKIEQVKEECSNLMIKWHRVNPQPTLVKEPKKPEIKGFLEKGAELSTKDRKIIEIFDFWPGYPPYWDFLRLRVLERDNNRCQISGCPNRLTLQIHHIKALSDGGGHQFNNLITLCEYHHGLQPQEGHKRIWGDIENTFFSMVRSHFRNGNIVKAHVRRKLLVSLDEIKKVVDYYEISCSDCGKAINFISINKERNIVTAGCSLCEKMFEFEQKLTEETCVAMGSFFKINRNKGKYDDVFFQQEDFRKAHYKKIDKMPRSRIENKIKDNTQVLCPKCGSIMKIRTAKKGTNAGSEFYGCSRFPECRGTRNKK